MLFGLISPRKPVTTSARITEIQNMLDRTWDLSTQFKTDPASPEHEPITAFNQFFSKLNHIITRILKNVIELASLAPAMFQFSREFREKTSAQQARISAIAKAGKAMAGQVDQIAGRTQRISDESMEIQTQVHGAMDQAGEAGNRFCDIKNYVGDLVNASEILDENSRSIRSIIDTLNQISDETNILSLNARIEAMRSNGDSAGFKVIAEEIASLAKQSRQATSHIGERLDVLSSKVGETVSAVAKVEKTVSAGEKRIIAANQALAGVHSRFSEFTTNLSSVRESSAMQSKAVNSVSSDIAEIEETVTEQARGVETIVRAAEDINQICDAMILDAGIFHLSSHRKIQAVAESLAQDTDIRSFVRSDQETALDKFMRRNPFIELAYITNATGRQVVENRYAENQDGVDHQDSCLDKDWSSKEWFTRPARNKKTFISQIYRSSATGQFCFTVSVPLLTDSQLVGVLGIDINFTDIIRI